MQRSTNRVLTTHTGSLPRPADILETMRAKATGEYFDQAAFEARLREAVAENVRLQVEAGMDVVNDGEVGKPSFNNYVQERLSGFEARPAAPGANLARTGPIDPNGRDAREFPDYYEYVLAHSMFEKVIRLAPRVCVGPIQYVGQALVQRDIANLKAALAEHQAVEAFLPSASPLSATANEYYGSIEEYAVAYADAMREEYRAILDAGLLLQIDDPSMVSAWDSRLDLSLEDYRRQASRRVELLNYALRDLPTDRIRYHTCYGVNFGPRVSDLQLESVVDIFFKINAGAYSFEASNPRHEHEWRLFTRVALPEGKVLIPGMVTHSNVMIEHPEGIADRMERWASTCGKENLIFGNDCGFASTAGNAEIPPTVAWAKLRALAEGARLATERLYEPSAAAV